MFKPDRSTATYPQEAGASLNQRVVAGDEAAFKLFFQQHQPRVFDYILRVVKSPEIAEELVLDIFLKIWLSKEMMAEVHNIDAFIYRMAVNKALDFLRIAAREKKLRLLLKEHIEREEVSVTTAYDTKEYQLQVTQCLQMLTQQQQLILNLSREEGLTHEQIAGRLNLSKNTVKNHMVTALKTFRQFIKKGHLSVFFIFF